MSGTLSPELAGRIRLVVLDVDGVLTDNGIYVGQTAAGVAVELKRFHVQDGLGIKLLEWAGVKVIFMSGRESDATSMRAAELGVEAYQDAGARKRATLDPVLERHGVNWDQVAVVADDLADLPLLRVAGLPVAVANAVPEVHAAAAWTTGRKGGEGAVREFAEALLRARSEWDAVVEAYGRSREDGASVPGHFAAVRRREGEAG